MHPLYVDCDNVSSSDSSQARAKDQLSCFRLVKERKHPTRRMVAATQTLVQRATDHEKVTGMIHKILKLGNVEITEVKRLSKHDDDKRPRLVWVKLGSRVQRNQVMKSKTKLKSSRWSNVFVTTDMTKKEKHEDYTLRKEVKERREKGERVQIQAGKVVQVHDTVQNSEQKKNEASRRSSRLTSASASQTM